MCWRNKMTLFLSIQSSLNLIQNVRFYTSILLLSRLSMRFWKFVITWKGKKKEKPLFWELQDRVSGIALGSNLLICGKIQRETGRWVYLDVDIYMFRVSWLQDQNIWLISMDHAGRLQRSCWKNKCKRKERLQLSWLLRKEEKKSRFSHFLCL